MSKLNVREDLSGQQFGHLTVVGFHAKTKAGASIWTCKCKCGNIKTVRGYHLKGKKIRSCGCAKRETVNIKWPGHEFISRWFWNCYRINAKRRKIEFQITPKDMWEQAMAQGVKCALTDTPLVFAELQRNREDGNASLDRIESSRGYVRGNIQWVLKDINVAKSDMSQDQFVAMCKLVTKKFK